MNSWKKITFKFNKLKIIMIKKYRVIYYKLGLYQE